MNRREGRWTAFADARGIDAKYAQVRWQVEEELAATEAGPHSVVSVPPDGRGMKNPHGGSQHPSPLVDAPARHAGAGPGGAGNSKEDRRKS
jgi:hypothetical protein